MAINLGRRPRGFNTPGAREDFDRTALALKGSAVDVCRHLLPHGRVEAGEWRAGSLQGDVGQSLGVNLREGVWKDFASDEGGADLISLWAAVRGIKQGEAKREADEWLGGLEQGGAAAARRAHNPEVAGSSPAPATKPTGSPDHKWEYYDRDGVLFGTVYRWDARDGAKKIIRPWDGKQWKAPEGLRPLLYTPEILAGPDPVVLVEGEKKCDRLRRVGVNATSLWGGAQAIDRTDWSILKGRSVAIWPDNDKPGLEFATKVTELLHGVGATVAVCQIPADKPEKWDADNADDAECREIVQSARPVKRLALVPTRNVREWAGAILLGDPEPIEWLVDNVFPIGGASLLAAEGGTGKGMLSLDLALKIAVPSQGAMNLNPSSKVLGQPVVAHGTAVVISAEDSAKAIRRRLASLDPDKTKRKAAGPRLIIQSLLGTPGGVKQLFVMAQDGTVQPTEEWERVCADLASIEDLNLVVFDPLTMFCPGGINVDPVVGQQVMNAFSRLADNLNIAVLVAHHMSKSGRGAPITTAEDARQVIRGSGALVDGVRLAYALWPATETEGRQACLLAGNVEWTRGKVVKGAVIKANDPADMMVRTFVRDDAGVLVEPGRPTPESAKALTDEERELLDDLIWNAQQGTPFSLTGKWGAWGKQDGTQMLSGSWPERDKGVIEKAVRKFEKLGLVQYGDLKRGGSAKAIDAPGGVYCMQTGTSASAPQQRKGAKPT